MSAGYPQNWDEIRNRVYQRDGYECQNCGIKGGSSGNAELHAHHIVPKASGGSHNEQNLVTLCKDCHNAIHHDDKEAPQPQSGSDAHLANLQSIETWEDMEKFGFGFKNLVDESNFLVALLSGEKNQIIRNNKNVAIQNIEETRGKFFNLKRLAKSYTIPTETVVKNTQIHRESEAREFMNNLMDKYINFADAGLEMCDLCVKYVEEVTTVSCSECGDTVPSSESYCGSCGASLPSIWECDSCGSDRLTLDNQFCSNCGTELDQVPKPKQERVTDIFKRETELESELRELKNDISDTVESVDQRFTSETSNSSRTSSSSENSHDGNPENAEIMGKLFIALIIVSVLVLLIALL
jgi:hypothetical protein